MYYIRAQLKKLGEFKLSMIILGLGILLGIIIAKGFKSFYWNDINILNINYLYEIKNASIDYSALFQFVLWSNFKTYIIFWVLCSTALGVPYIIILLIYKGFQCGFVLSILLMRFKLKGILLIFGYTFPHYFIYIPVAYLCLRSGFWLCSSMYYDNHLSRRGRAEKIIKHLGFIFIMGILLVVGGFFETYIGTLVLRSILKLF